MPIAKKNQEKANTVDTYAEVIKQVYDWHASRGFLFNHLNIVQQIILDTKITHT